MIGFRQGVTAVSLLMLAACGEGEKGTTSRVEVSASKSASPMASSVPEPREGLWRVTTLMVTPQGEMGLPATDVCQTPEMIRKHELPDQAEGAQCDTPNFVRVGDGYQAKVRCQMDGATADYQMTMTGDFNKAYQTEIISRITPEPAPGMGQTTMRLKAEYLGPCPKAK